MHRVGGEGVASAEVDTWAGVYEVPLGTDAALGIGRAGFSLCFSWGFDEMCGRASEGAAVQGGSAAPSHGERGPETLAASPAEQCVSVSSPGSWKLQPGLSPSCH